MTREERELLNIMQRLYLDLQVVETENKRLRAQNKRCMQVIEELGAKERVPGLEVVNEEPRRAG